MIKIYLTPIDLIIYYLIDCICILLYYLEIIFIILLELIHCNYYKGMD